MSACFAAFLDFGVHDIYRAAVHSAQASELTNIPAPVEDPTEASLTDDADAVVHSAAGISNDPFEVQPLDKLTFTQL